MKTIKVSVGAVMEGTFTLGPGTYHVYNIEGELWIEVDVEDNVPTFAEALPALGDLERIYELVREIQVPLGRRSKAPSFWRRRCAERPPFLLARPDTHPRRTGRRSRDGRWFRGDRQLAMVGVN